MGIENKLKLKNQVNYEEKRKHQKITLECPICNTRNHLSIPTKIINESKQLTTISVPKNLICNHHFQVFVDKNFKIRGYQKIDFELSRMEFYQKSIKNTSKIIGQNLASLPVFEKILNKLRRTINDKNVLGCAILTVNGKVLYSSLPENSLFTTLKEFKVRNEKELVSIKRMFLELENNIKICSHHMDLNDIKFILVLVFSKDTKLGMSNLLLTSLATQINSLI